MHRDSSFAMEDGSALRDKEKESDKLMGTTRYAEVAFTEDDVIRLTNGEMPVEEARAFLTTNQAVLRNRLNQAGWGVLVWTLKEAGWDGEMVVPTDGAEGSRLGQV